MSVVQPKAAAKRAAMISDASKRPARSSVAAEEIPLDLQSVNNWLCWQWYLKLGRWTKKPLQASGLAASVNDPSHRGSFEACLAAYQSSKSIDGIGFAITPGYLGLDIDGCFDGHSLTADAQRIVDAIDSYTEISPSGTGIKIFGTGYKPQGFKTPLGVELYTNKYFTVTGRVLGDAHAVRPMALRKIEDRAAPSESVRQAISQMRKIEIKPDESDGSGRLVKYARVAVRLGLDEGEALEAIQNVLEERPAPRAWTEEEILTRVSQAGVRHTEDCKSGALSFAQLRSNHPRRKPELIHGLLRRGEVMSIIGAPKQGKSWFVYGLALSVASGQSWLGREVEQGNVLLIDNELHADELSYRLGQAADGFFVSHADLQDRITIEPLRGRQQSVDAIDRMLKTSYAGKDISLIILDAYYRLLPPGMSENDNGAVTQIFNRLDAIAERHSCSIAVIHHTSKGDQSGKNVTDVGAGAGALTRATDTHLVVRPHEKEHHAVIEAVCRSHAEPEPQTIRFDFPIWRLESEIEPTIKRPKTAFEERQNDVDKETDSCVLNALKNVSRATLLELVNSTSFGRERITRSLTRLERKDLVYKRSIKRKKTGKTAQVWRLKNV